VNCKDLLIAILFELLITFKLLC